MRVAGGATTELASYIVSARLEAIPADVRHEAHHALLNYVGCAIGGSREPTVDMTICALAPFAGRPAARILGRLERIDPRAGLNAIKKRDPQAAYDASLNHIKPAAKVALASLSR